VAFQDVIRALLRDRSPNLHGWQPPSAEGLALLLKELQGLKLAIVNGANINTNIAIAGILREDTLVFVVRFPAAYAVANITSHLTETSITSDGNIQLTTTNTTGDRLIVGWYDKR
jgi:predicted benzoate:H+ symporter BenE